MALKDITLGQYFPGNSPVHRLDPRTKILTVVLYITALFLAKSFVTYGIMFLVLCASIALSKVPVKSILRGLKPVLFIAVFTAVLNLLYTRESMCWQNSGSSPSRWRACLPPSLWSSAL